MSVTLEAEMTLLKMVELAQENMQRKNEVLPFYVNYEISWRPEFLKAAIIQSHDCAQYLRICANVGLINAKHEHLALISCICHNLTKFFSSFTCCYVIETVTFNH